jgi:hypothetical protein
LFNLETATDLQDLKKRIDSKIVQLESGEYGCTDCDYTSKFRHNLPKHIEARHVMIPGLQCNTCMKVCPTRESFRRHVAGISRGWDLMILFKLDFDLINIVF